MLKPLNNNLLLTKVQKNTSGIYLPEDNDCNYYVEAQGDQVKAQLVGKVVITKDILKKVCHDGKGYYLVQEEDIIAIIED